MAIGLALLLGFQLAPELRPPLHARPARNEFWRRWHMTLSRWLRDYLYIPLGGNRGGPRRTYRNLMLTMLLGGLWHGAAWTFVLWGGIHGSALAIERWLRERFGGVRMPALVGWLRHIPGGLPRMGVLPRARPRPRRSRCSAGSAPPARRRWSRCRSCSSRSRRWPCRRCRRTGGATPRRGWWPGPPWRQGVALGLVVVAADAAVGQQGVAPFIYYRF